MKIREFVNGIPSGSGQERKKFRVGRFVASKDGRWSLCFLNAPFSSILHVWELPEFAPYWLRIVVSGPGACFGMFGYVV